MYTLQPYRWHSVYNDIALGTEGTKPEVVTLESLGLSLGIPVIDLKGVLENFAASIEDTKPVAKQWFNASTNLGAKDVCTLADAWRLLVHYGM